MKSNVLFGISDNDDQHQERNSVDGSTWRNGAGLTLIRCTIAIYYTENVLHFELLGESRNK